MSEAEYTQPPPVRITPWAFAALICSIGIFCPLLTVLGPILGLKALAEIRSRPGIGGTRIAIAGIVIGVGVTLGWGSIAFWWDRNVRRPLIDGPIATLQAGLRGETAAFKAGFFGPGAEVEDEVAHAFLSEVASRYGMVVNMVQDETREPPESAWGAISPIVPYLIEFEGAFLAGEAEFVILDERAPGIIGKWRWIIIRDPELGDLHYPPAADKMRERTIEQVISDRPEATEPEDEHADDGDESTE